MWHGSRGGLSTDSFVPLDSWKPRCRIQPSWEEAGKDRTGNAGCRRQSAKDCSKLKPRWEMGSRSLQTEPTSCRSSRSLQQDSLQKHQGTDPMCAPGPRAKAEGWSPSSSSDGKSCYCIPWSWWAGQGCSDALSFLVVGKVRLT